MSQQEIQTTAQEPEQVQEQQNEAQEQDDTQKLEKNQSHIDCSLFVAKKAEQQAEKDIELLANRINLLRKEEERTIKKIQDTQLKTKCVLEMKRRNDENSQKKNASKKNDNDFLDLMQKKSYELRRQQEDERFAILSALKELKREEANEVKRQRKANLEKINAAKNKQLEEKMMRHRNVQQLKNDCRKNVDLYWTGRLKGYEQNNDKKKHAHVKSKNQKDFVLGTLEKEELELIKRLQYSQEVHDGACKELEGAITLNYVDYVKNFGANVPLSESKMQDKTQMGNNTQNHGSQKNIQEQQKSTTSNNVLEDVNKTDQKQEEQQENEGEDGGEENQE